MLNCTPCWMKRMFLLLNAQLYTMFDVRYPTPANSPNMGYGGRGTCSNLPRAIQLGQERKWVTKRRTSWKNVETLKTEASKQAATEGHTYVHTPTILLRG
jgi:hypothetical protein